MRLDKYLSDLGIGTRSELRAAIRGGRAVVNGLPAKDPGQQLKGDEEVAFDGRILTYKKYVYYMLNKPAGVITAVQDARQKTVLDLLGERRRKDLFPVGRLDKDTTGLLLLTNDGDFGHRLMSPKRHVEKRYVALVSGEVTEEDIEAFAKGLYVKEEMDGAGSGNAGRKRVHEAFTAAPAQLKILSREESEEAGKSGASLTEVEITIHEGKYHQVKRMMAAVGKEVLTLKRVAIGPLELDPELREGDVRELTNEERTRLLGQ